MSSKNLLSYSLGCVSLCLIFMFMQLPTKANVLPQVDHTVNYAGHILLKHPIPYPRLHQWEPALLPDNSTR